jgi:hypothetical protein
MRGMLLTGSVVALAATIAVVAFAAGGPATKGPPVSAPDPVAGAPTSGPFALAAQRAQSEASAERHRAARAAYSAHEHGDYRPSSAPHGARIHLIRRVAARLGVGRRTMWRAVADVRRQISPREWSDARDEALRMLARELDRPSAEVARAVRVELRRQLATGSSYGYGYEGGR